MSREITSSKELRELVGAPEPIAIAKVLPHLEVHSRRFVSLSPFICVATMSADGRCDVSPKGDPPGFVRALDDHTLLIPDRKGNRRVDSMENLIENPSVGLIFFVPGIDETLRVNGKAFVIDDPQLLAASEVRGHVPTLGLRVDVEEVFFHCGKALKRSHLWDPNTHADPYHFPSVGRIIAEQARLKLTRPEVQQVERATEEDYRTGLY